MSAKYPFYGKKGRPSNIERDICQKIRTGLANNEFTQADVDGFIGSDGLPMNQSELETLYTTLTGESAIGGNDGGGESHEHESSQGSGGQEDYPSMDDVDDGGVDDDVSYEDDLIDNSSSTSAGGGKNHEAINFDPFAEPVIERDYTKGISNTKLGGADEHSDSEEHSDDDEHSGGSQEESRVSFDDNDTADPNLDTESINTGDGISDVNYEEVEDDIPEPQWNNTSEISEDEIDDGGEEDDEGDGGDKLGGDNLQDMSPAQKRKSAEKTAEAIMQMYGKFAPLPFQQWASFSEKKITKMILDGKIDPNMQLENNVTVQEYIDGVNKQAEGVFEVTDETKEEIKDPLIDVLMEQELALTPTQRLLMAVGSHIVTMGFSAFQLAQNNKMALETFEKFHQQTRQQNEPVRPTQANNENVNFEEEFTGHDINEVNEIIDTLNEDDDGIIDAEHDPLVDVEETHDD